MREFDTRDTNGQNLKTRYSPLFSPLETLPNA